MNMRIPVFYTPHMNGKSEDTDSPSAGKPRLVVDDWLMLGTRIEIVEPEPATRQELCLAHNQEYVDGVLQGLIDNGFGCRSQSVARSLPWTTGSMLSAARFFLSTDFPKDTPWVAVSPTSGFHHAHYSRGMGFCTFNGLMVTALALLEQEPEIRIGILDCDYHYGDGTDDILGHSRMRGSIDHWTAGKFFRARTRADEFINDALPRTVVAAAGGMTRDCDIILYQAGADPHIDDPYGGFLTSEQLRMRDRIVFEACAETGTPVVWNLAGGYQRDKSGGIEPVLAIHRATLEECVRIFT